MYNEKDDFIQHEAEISAFLEVLNTYTSITPKHMNVLDLGAGQGMHAGFLGQHFNEVYCSDIVNYTDLYGGEFFKLLKEKHDRHGHPLDLKRTHFIRTDGMDLLYKDSYFDFIVTFNTFEHIPDPKKSLDEMIRCTKPGGHVFIQFDPIWTADTGSHFSHRVPEPWAHLICSEREYIDKMIAGGASDDETREFIGAMNRRRLAYYRTIFNDNGPERDFEIVHQTTWSGVSDPKNKKHEHYKECIRRNYTSEELMLRGMRFLLRVTDRAKARQPATVSTDTPLIPSSLEKNDLFDVLTYWVYRLTLHQGDTAVDIGANQGMHTQVLADVVGESGRVYSFEPVPFLYNDLSTRLAHLHQVVVLPYACSFDEGPASFFVNLIDASFCSGLQKQDSIGGVKAYPITVESRRLDSMDLDGHRIRVIKIDVEGAELLALRGAKNHIAKHRPVCVYEWGDAVSAVYGTSSSDMWDFWHQQKYSLLDLQGTKITSSSSFCRSSSLQNVWNYVAVPKENSKMIDTLADALKNLWSGLIVEDTARKYRSTLAFGKGTPGQLIFSTPYDQAKLKIKITNRSNFAWINIRNPFYSDVPSKERFKTNVMLGLRWFTQEGIAVTEDRRELPVAAMFPGQSLDLDITLYPYTVGGNMFFEPGKYKLTVGLVHEFVNWFSRAGDKDLSITIVVS